MRRRTLAAALAATAVVGGLLAGAALAAGHSGRTRVAAWSPSMTGGGPHFADRTIRMAVHPSVGGNAVRIRLSNLRGTTPLTVGAANIAAQSSRAAAVAGSQHTVTFGHKESVTIPAGAEVVSDSVPMTVKAGRNVLVSVYLPHATGPSTWHPDAFDTSYVSVPGDHTADTANGNFTTPTTSWYFLAGLDVSARHTHGTVVAFGDSITDGYNTPAGAYRRWPDDLARRLSGTHPMGVVDAGIGGNRLLTDAHDARQGLSGTRRFAHDALGQPGVRDVILLEGINDIGDRTGPGGAPLTAQDLISGYRDLIGQAHAAGVRIIGGTLLPDKGNNYYSPAAEAIRQAANTWIRTSGAFDGVADFDKALASPSDPAALDPAYDCGDHLHPNAAGMQALADAVDLSLLT